MGAQVGLEVRGLGVRLGAAGERAQVRRHLLATPALATFATTNQRAALAIAALPPPPHPKKKKKKSKTKMDAQTAMPPVSSTFIGCGDDPLINDVTAIQ